MTRYAQEIGSVSLAVMVSHAHEIVRSNAEVYPDLRLFPSVKESARRVVAAARDGVTADLTAACEALNDTLKQVRAAKGIKASSKPTVGKAKDRLGEKTRRAEEKAAAHSARRAAVAQVQAQAPVDSLWGAL